MRRRAVIRPQGRGARPRITELAGLLAAGASRARIAGVAGVLAVGIACGACGAPDAGAERSAAASSPAGARQDTGWIVLFDGTDLSAWRGYRRPDPPSGWQVRERALTLVPGRDGGDLVTREEFGDFELRLSWRIGPGGNSGIFYRAGEDADAIWQSAPEMQVLDDERHPDGHDPATSAGSVFALYPPAADVVSPAGRWNEVRIVARGRHVEHWLNGARIVEYEVGSDDWNARVAASKFAAYPGFGEARRGRIALQDHGDPVAYREIRIRPLEEEP